MIIQWFPGHMTKTRRQIQDSIKQVDVVIELTDARIPVSSRNPEIDFLTAGKPRIVVLNKSDLADEGVSRQWERYFKACGTPVIYTNSLTGTGLKELVARLKQLTQGKLEKAMNRGRLIRPIRTMVVGVPNVGKSAFINKICGKAKAETGDRPGVTRTQQWIRIHPEIQLLDTPGILWPKFEDMEVGMNLAFTGAVKDDVIDTAELAGELMKRLSVTYPQQLAARYKMPSFENKTGLDMLAEAGKRRGCLIAGGEVDIHRAAAIVLDEFRGGKIGRITLELPPPIESIPPRPVAVETPPDPAETGIDPGAPVVSRASNESGKTEPSDATQTGDAAVNASTDSLPEEKP